MARRKVSAYREYWDAFDAEHKRRTIDEAKRKGIRILTAIEMEHLRRLLRVEADVDDWISQIDQMISYGENVKNISDMFGVGFTSDEVQVIESDFADWDKEMDEFEHEWNLSAEAPSEIRFDALEKELVDAEDREHELSVKVRELQREIKAVKIEEKPEIIPPIEEVPPEKVIREEFAEKLRGWDTGSLLLLIQDISTSSEERDVAIEVLAERGVLLLPCPDHPDALLIPMLEIDGIVLADYGLEAWECPVDGTWYWRDIRGRIRPTRRDLIIAKVRGIRAERAPPPPEVPVVELTFKFLMAKTKPELVELANQVEEPTDEVAQFFYNRDVWNPDWGVPAAYGITDYWIATRGRAAYLAIVEEYGADTTGANLGVMYKNGIWHEGWGDPRLRKLPPVPKGAVRTDDIYIW